MPTYSLLKKHAKEKSTWHLETSGTAILLRADYTTKIEIK
jgi:hypothetical protein